MRVRAHQDVKDFWTIAEPLLAADPVTHTVAVTIVFLLLADRPFSAEPPILLTVHPDDSSTNGSPTDDAPTDTDDAPTGGSPASGSGAELLGVAVCTPPFPMVVTALPAEAAPAVVAHLRKAGHHLPGVSGRKDRANVFSAIWSEVTGDQVKINRDERLYTLDRLTPPANVPGMARLATEDDIPLLARWRAEFAAEALGDESRPDDYVAQSRDSIAAGAADMLWTVDGEPVSLAVTNQPNAGMSRVGSVYTPVDQRGHGYGSAVTAAVSQWALDRGAAHVLLFTDLANPTSNSIYQKIGYRPVSDYLNVAFVPSR